MARPRKPAPQKPPRPDRTALLPLALRRHPGSDTDRWQAAGGKPSCTGCVAHCCRYVAVEIDRPRAKWQYDQIHWMLLHEDVSVYVDLGGKWFTEFHTRCRMLTDRNLCAIYEQRPRLCQEYDVNSCPVWSKGNAHRVRFESAESFAAWLDGKGVDWRYRDPLSAQRHERGPTLLLPRRTPGRARSGGVDRGRARSPRA